MTGLIGWWHLGEQSGQANDLSGEGNHGTVNGATQGVWGRGGLTAYSFDGTDDNVNVGNTPSLSEYTVTARFRLNSNSSQGAIITREANGPNIVIRGDGSGNLVYYHRSSNGYQQIASTAVNNYQWYQASLTWDGSTVIAYLDGEIVNSGNYSTTGSGNNNDRIGSDSGAAGQFFDGSISGVKIYDRAISPQEIQTLYEWGSGDYTDPTLTRTQADEVSQIGWDGTGDSGTGFTGLWFSEDGEAVTNTTEVGFQ